MAQYTTRLRDRDPDKLQLTKTEAAAMLQAGFKFAEFNTDGDRYRLSIPYKFIANLDLDFITLEQG